MNNFVKKELHDISENPEKTKTKIKELYIELEGSEMKIESVSFPL